MPKRDTTEVTLQINLLRGDPIRCKADVTETQRRNLGTALERAFSSNFVGVELAGKLVLVPLANIQSVEINPAPAVIIRGVARNTRPA